MPEFNIHITIRPDSDRRRRPAGTTVNGDVLSELERKQLLALGAISPVDPDTQREEEPSEGGEGDPSAAPGDEAGTNAAEGEPGADEDEAEEEGELEESEEEAAGDQPPTLEQAIAQVAAEDPRDEGHWTKGGKPDAKYLTEITGTEVSAAERDAAWSAHQEQAG